GAVDVLIAQDERQRRDLWETRRRVNPTLKELHRHKIAEDVVVPRSAMPEMLRRIEALAAELRLPIATYGHAADRNLHINPWIAAEGVRERAHGAVDAIMRATLELRGSLAGEHGVGLMKMKYVPWEHAPPLLRIQRQLKRVFDPDDLLNPGKIFPA